MVVVVEWLVNRDLIVAFFEFRQLLAIGCRNYMTARSVCARIDIGTRKEEDRANG